MTETAVIRCQGHANVRATHDRTIEVVSEDSITQAGTCIIGVRATYDPQALGRLRGRIAIELRAGSIEERLTARVNPLYLPGDPLIVRKSDRVQRRSFAIGATKGSADLDRELIAALQQPGAALEISIEEVGSDRSGSGALYLVSVPIGNDEDLSLRARRVLKAVDLIACEDTRVSGQLLKAIGAEAPMISYHEHNEEARAEEIAEKVERGARVAVISDAGTPGLSDPGWRVVSAAIARGLVVTPVPGPSALLSALVASGMPTDAFVFDGFLPRASAARTARLRELAAMSMTAIVYESPHRLEECLEDVATVFGERTICAARELTKHNEELVRGSARAILAELSGTERMRGEFVLVLPPIEREPVEDELPDWADTIVRTLVEQEVPTRAIAAALSAALGWTKKRAYDFVVQRRTAIGR